MQLQEIEAYVDAAAKALGLRLAPEHRPGALHYFALAAGMAEQLSAVPLGVDDEVAFVFTPLAPDDLAKVEGEAPASPCGE